MQIQKGSYQHFRNKKFYEVVDVVHNADNELGDNPLDFPYVLYKSDNGQLWIRPLAQFTETVEHEGQKLPRFKLVE